MSIRSQGSSQFAEKLVKLVYTARQVVPWRRRYNDELPTPRCGCARERDAEGSEELGRDGRPFLMGQDTVYR